MNNGISWCAKVLWGHQSISEEKARTMIIGIEKSKRISLDKWMRVVKNTSHISVPYRTSVQVSVNTGQ